MKVLFIVDPQNDFVDAAGSLYVKGAEEAIDNICKLLREGGYDRVIVSQDCHQYYHIGHSEFWKELPEPGTEIDITRDLSRGNFTPALCDFETPKDVIRQILEKNARSIRIWPHHCLEGSWGYCFPERLVDALNEWAAQHLRSYEVYQKGKDPFCESFSLLDEYTPDFSGTTVFHICGFCKDICVYETFKAIIEKEVLPYYTEEISVIGDCSLAYGEDGDELKKKYDAVVAIFENTRKKAAEEKSLGEYFIGGAVEEAPAAAPAPHEVEAMPRNMAAGIGGARLVFEEEGDAREEAPAENEVRDAHRVFRDAPEPMDGAVIGRGRMVEEDWGEEDLNQEDGEGR